MLIKYQALSAHLKNTSKKFYLLSGNDPFLLNSAADMIRRSWMQQEDSERKVLDINSASDWSSAIQEANSYSLFSNKMLLDIRFDKKTIDKSGKQILSEYLSDINHDCLILIRAPQLTVSSLQWLISSSQVTVIQVVPFNSVEFINWILSLCHEKQLKIDLQVPSLIYQYTQGNMLAAYQVIEKLSLISEDEHVFSTDEVQNHLSFQSEFQLFHLAEELLQGDLSKSLQILEKHRQQRTEATFVLWIIASEIRQCIQLHVAINQGTSFNSACQSLKIWSSRTQAYKVALQRLQLPILYKILGSCHKIDMQIRSVDSAQVWLGFEQLIISFCNSKIYQDA